MSEIKNLIDKFCPNGVKYKRVGDISEVGTGSSNGNEASDEGAYPFFIRSQTVKAKDDYEYDEEAIIIPGEGGVGDIYHYINGKYALHQRVYRIHFTTKEITTRFAYYCFNEFFKAFIMKKAVSATVTSIRKPMIQDFTIPIPPLPVQEEIVHILDNFTDLTAELQAELQARAKQYDYYRDNMLTFDESVPRMKLSSIAQIYDGTHQTPEYKDSGIPFISVENIGDIYNSKKYITKEAFDAYKIKPKKGDLFMTRIGSIGVCAVFDHDEDIAYYVSLALIRPNPEIVKAEYLKFVIESLIGRKELRKRTLVNAVPIKVNKDDIGKITLPIPSLEVQDMIIDKLKRFDDLCVNISNGLPAEIEARQKQYEYYRDQLLSFKKAN